MLILVWRGGQSSGQTAVSYHIDRDNLIVVGEALIYSFKCTGAVSQVV